jgi:hypothetical protein
MDRSQWCRRPHFGRQDRRAESRDDCAGSAVIDVLAPQIRRAISVKVVDVGGGGLKLIAPCFLTPGAILRIRLTEAVVQAEVKYCSCEAREYHVGVAVEEINTSPRLN